METANIQTHLEQSMQLDIDRIRTRLTEMSSLGETALQNCLKVITEGNRQLAYATILRDQYIDEMEKEIDRLCLEFIVRQQPVASLLRFAYAAIKINLELERVGDYAESIARQSLKLEGMDVAVPKDRFKEIGQISVNMLHDSIQAFVNQDAELARKTIAVEETVDVLKSRLNRELIGLFRENRLPFEALNPLVMISRRFERVSDQARNICMETLYMCTGEYAKHPGTEAFRILFVDEHNSCRSVMAEAIANSLNQPKFIFASAGLKPQPIESATMNFMKQKGFDISQQTSKSLNQIPHLEYYNVIVSLAEEAKHAFPQRPRKVVHMDWTVPDPSTVKGDTAQVSAAYEATYQFIHSHIQDLVAAILGEKKP